MEVTAKKEDGTVIGTVKKIYMPQATNQLNEKQIFGAQNKVGYVRNTSLEAYESKDESIEFDLPEGVRTANIEVELTYQLFADDKIPIHKVTKTVSLDR